MQTLHPLPVPHYTYPLQLRSSPHCQNNTYRSTFSITCNHMIARQSLRHRARSPHPPDFDCSIRISDQSGAKICLPHELSPRITNRDLVMSLRRDTSLHLSSPRFRVRKQVPVLREPPTPPRFKALPSLTTRNRSGTELSPSTEAVLKDPTSLPQDTETLRIIVNELRTQRDHVGDTGNYQEAYRYQRALRSATRKLEYEESHECEVSNMHGMVTRHQELESIVSNYQQEWDRNFEEFLKTTERDEAQLRARHAREIEDYDSTIPTGISRKYNKRSPRLLSLRTKEARLALTKQYIAADKMREQAEMEEIKESQNAMEKTNQEWLAQREKLLSAQEREFTAFLQHAESTRKIMVLTRDKRLSGYLKRMAALDKHITKFGQTRKVDDDYDEELSNGRADFVVREEMNTPIPPFRSGTIFTTTRQRIRSAPRGRRLPLYK